MGIFRYFYWHFQTYPDTIIQVMNKQRIPGFDLFALDLNAIFHPVCQRYYFETPGIKTDEGCYSEICKEIEMLLSYVEPKEELILSIDGVAGMSKVNQQRQRRYRSVKEKSADVRAVFDSNQISVGTEWLRGLSTALHLYFCVKPRPYKVVLQDESIIGEGEHKIIRYLHGKEKKKIVIYSPDADLLMLGLVLGKKNVFIFRPNIYTQLDVAYFLVSMDKFKKSISKMIDPREQYLDRIDPMVRDFIFLLFFLGNDFLPHSPSYEIRYGGIDKILDLYHTALLDRQLELIHIEEGVYHIHTRAFRYVLEELAKEEKNMIQKRYKFFRGFPDRMLDKYIVKLDTQFNAYRNEYYHHHFPGQTLDTICKEYIRGLCFVGTYYHVGMPDWWYVYPFRHGPFFQELLEYVSTQSEGMLSFPFESHHPLLPLEQLMCVLPYESRKWLPSGLQKYYEKGSELEAMYPRDFELIRDGVSNEYEALVILPDIPLDQVREVMKREEMEFTEAERARNTHTPLVINY
jgi:5'-3' exonuclease